MLNMPAAKRAPSFEELYLAIERLPQGITGQILVPIHPLPAPTARDGCEAADRRGRHRAARCSSS
jgi:hypothetical protein